MNRQSIIKEYHDLGLETILSPKQYLEWHRKNKMKTISKVYIPKGNLRNIVLEITQNNDNDEQQLIQLDVNDCEELINILRDIAVRS